MKLLKLDYYTKPFGSNMVRHLTIFCQVGDQVRAVYSEDGLEYEGSVVFCNKANKSVTVR